MSFLFASLWIGCVWLSWVQLGSPELGSRLSVGLRAVPRISSFWRSYSGHVPSWWMEEVQGSQTTQAHLKPLLVSCQLTLHWPKPMSMGQGSMFLSWRRDMARRKNCAQIIQSNTPWDVGEDAEPLCASVFIIWKMGVIGLLEGLNDLLCTKLLEWCPAHRKHLINNNYLYLSYFLWKSSKKFLISGNPNSNKFWRSFMFTLMMMMDVLAHIQNDDKRE